MSIFTSNERSERLTARAEGLSAAKRERERESLRRPVQQSRDRLYAVSQSWRDANASYEAYRDAVKSLEVEDSALESASSARTIATILAGPATWVAVTVIDSVLLGAVAKYMIGLSFDTETVPGWAPFALAIVIVVLEIIVGRWAASSAALIGRAMACVLAIAVPSLAAATTSQALVSESNWNPLIKILFVVGVTAISIVSHVLVLCSGASALESLTYITHRARHRHHTRNAGVQLRRVGILRDRAGETWRVFQPSLARLETSFGIANDLRIPPHDAMLINNAVGAVIVRVGLDEGVANAPDNSARGDTRSSSSAGQPSEHEDQSEELEYWRRTMRARQQDIDSEIIA